MTERANRGYTTLIAIRDVAGRQGKCYRFGGRDFVWGGFESCWWKGAHFRAGLGVGSFIPAFARCCFRIAASLLVFTSPMTSPLALLHQSYCVNGEPPSNVSTGMAAAEIRHVRLANRCRDGAVQTNDYFDNPFYIFWRNHSRLE